MEAVDCFYAVTGDCANWPVVVVALSEVGGRTSLTSWLAGWLTG